MFKFNIEDTRTTRSGVFIVYFVHIFTPSSSVFIVGFEQVMFAGIILAALLENKNFTTCFSNILPTFQPIQGHSPFHTETNQLDL